MSDRLHLRPKHRDRLETLLRKHLPDVEVWAYGSRVNGRSHDGSDLDLVLRGPDLDEIPVDRLVDFEEALRESNIPFIVEARDWARLPVRFHREIEREHVVVKQSMPCRDWRKVAIGEIADIVGGGTPSTKKAGNFDGTIPWLTPKDLSGIHDRYMARGERNLSRQGLDSSSAKLLPAGSVLLSTRAPIGYVALAKNPVSTNQGFRNLVVRDGVFPEYLYYWLRLNTEELERYASGSTFRELSSSSLKKIQLFLPPLPEQRAIAHILGTLDDKIELNRRMNETLEAMARAIFQDWFVDFGPVKAKMEGRDPYLPPELWGLFPDRLSFTEIGEIPERWEVGHVEDGFDIIMGQSPPGHTYNETGDGLPFFQGRSDFGFRYPKNRKFCTAPNRIAQPWDTIVSVRAPVGDINMAWEQCCIGRGVATLRPRSGTVSYGYYAAQDLQKYMREYENTGTVFGAINRKQLEWLPLLQPTPSIICGFEKFVHPKDQMIRLRTADIATLIALRDSLLSKLISGRIRLRDAERLVGDAA